MKYKIGQEIKLISFDTDMTVPPEYLNFIGLTGTVVDIIDEYDTLLPVGVELINNEFLWCAENELELI